MSKNQYIGDFVFATADPVLAAMYLATRGVATLMNTTGEQPWIVLACDPAEYVANDRGGAIYELPATSFGPTPQAGLEDYEFVSREGVKPNNKRTYETSLEAISQAGATIYFISQEEFDKLVTSDDKGQSAAVARLKPYLA